MRGCDGGHNCDVVDTTNPLAHRFDSGRFILDPGGKTLNHVRIAEASALVRGASRSPAVFNRFNRSYFAIVQP